MLKGKRLWLLVVAVFLVFIVAILSIFIYKYLTFRSVVASISNNNAVVFDFDKSYVRTGDSVDGFKVPSYFVSYSRLYFGNSFIPKYSTIPVLTTAAINGGETKFISYNIDGLDYIYKTSNGQQTPFNKNELIDEISPGQYMDIYITTGAPRTGLEDLNINTSITNAQEAKDQIRYSNFQVNANQIDIYNTVIVPAQIEVY